MASAVVAAALAAVTVMRGTDVNPATGAGTDVQNFSCDTTAMQIQFIRSGGFAGMTFTATIDTDSLPEGERDRICQLVEDAKFFSLPAILVEPNPQPDGITYEVTIEHEGRSHTVSTSDEAAPSTLVPLLDWLNRAARRQRDG
jgi:hypothetical protein